MFRKKEKKVKRKKHVVQEYAEAILFAFVVAMIIRNYTIQMFKIPSSSMETTLLIGDYLVGNKLKYFFTDPQREDIVIFFMPPDPEQPQPRDQYWRIIGPVYFDKNAFRPIWYQKKNVVKRVIGMPGDEVEIKDKVVHVNGEPMRREYEQYIDRRVIPREAGNITWVNGQNMGSRDNFGPVVVPEDHYFVLGDNRDMSEDSRYWGFVHRHEITGTPALITFSYGAPPMADIRDYFYQQRGLLRQRNEIRWNRVFKVIK
jgi:signal peptidase I